MPDKREGQLRDSAHQTRHRRIHGSRNFPQKLYRNPNWYFRFWSHPLHHVCRHSSLWDSKPQRPLLQVGEVKVICSFLESPFQKKASRIFRWLVQRPFPKSLCLRSFRTARGQASPRTPLAKKTSMFKWGSKWRNGCQIQIAWRSSIPKEGGRREKKIIAHKSGWQHGE